MSAFDAAAWLAAFSEAGGSYALTSEGRLWLGSLSDDRPFSLANDVAWDSDRIASVKALVRERCLIAE